MLLVISLGEVVTTTPVGVDRGSVGLPIDVSGVNRTFSFTAEQKYMIAYVLFGSVWIYEVVVAAGHFAISHVIAVRRRMGERAPHFLPLLRGYFNGVVYHLGTLAFGGFVVGVMSILTAGATWLSRRVAKPGERGNPVAKLCCCCCMGFMTWVTQTVNDMAYIDVVLYGRNYTEAAWHVWKLTIENPMTATAVVGTVKAVKTAGIILITGTGTSCAYWILSNPVPVSSFLGSLQELGLASGEADGVIREIGSSLLTANVLGMTAMSGVICYFVSLAFMNTLVATAQALAYVEVCQQASGGRGARRGGEY